MKKVLFLMVSAMMLISTVYAKQQKQQSAEPLQWVCVHNFTPTQKPIYVNYLNGAGNVSQISISYSQSNYFQINANEKSIQQSPYDTEIIGDTKKWPGLPPMPLSLVICSSNVISTASLLVGIELDSYFAEATPTDFQDHSQTIFMTTFPYDIEYAANSTYSGAILPGGCWDIWLGKNKPEKTLNNANL